MLGKQTFLGFLNGYGRNGLVTVYITRSFDVLCVQGQLGATGGANLTHETAEGDETGTEGAGIGQNIQKNLSNISFTCSNG